MFTDFLIFDEKKQENSTLCSILNRPSNYQNNSDIKAKTCHSETVANLKKKKKKTLHFLLQMMFPLNSLIGVLKL